MNENQLFLSTQLITYIGNKRALLDFIGTALSEIKKNLGKDKISFFDVFSGSGIVSRYAKQHSDYIIANDLELYSKIINKCYLSNYSKNLFEEINFYYKKIKQEISRGLKSDGFIYELYCPKDIDKIKEGERCFYTPRNGMFLDTACSLIKDIPDNLQVYFKAPLLAEASVHTNTAGVFKGFYKNKETGLGQFGGKGKNALERILGNIELQLPVFSVYNCESEVVSGDANKVVKNMPLVDVVYIDPPYNQHPYGSNYFMLNIISDYKRPEKISHVSGIPEDWNRSSYNKQHKVKEAFEDLIKSVRGKYILVSYNSESFLSKQEIEKILSDFGNVSVLEKQYNTYRGSRNLKERNIYVYEYLFILKKF